MKQDVIEKLRRRYVMIPIIISIVFLITLFSAFLSIDLLVYRNDINNKSELLLQNNIKDTNKLPIKDYDLKKCATFFCSDSEAIDIDRVEWLGAFSIEEIENVLAKIEYRIPHSKNRILDNLVEVDGRYFHIDTIVLDMNNVPVRKVAIYECTTENREFEKTITNFVLIFLLTLSVISIVAYILVGKVIKPIRKAFDNQRELVANASHELKTPLTIISSNLDLLTRNKDATIQDNKKWIDSSVYQVERMNSLVKQMLELSALEQSNMTGEKENVNLSDMVEGVVLSFEALLYEKNVLVEENVEKNVHYHCNKIEIEKLINILMDNAKKYVNDGGKINVTLKCVKRNIVFSVNNTGGGISSAEQENIFQRFYKTDVSHIESGNSFGLGLAIAKTIVENANGKISCRSDEKSWTTFEVKLPIRN